MCKEEKIIFDPERSKKAMTMLNLKNRKSQLEKAIIICKNQLIENTKKVPTMELCILDNDIRLKIEVLNNKLEKIEKEIEELS